MNKKATWIATTIIMGGTSILAAAATSGRTIEMHEPHFPFEQAVHLEMQAKGHVTAEKAKELALAKYDGQIEHLELKTDDETVYYEVEISNDKEKYKVYINFYTGELIEAGDKDSDDSSDVLTILSMDQAIQIALAKVSGDVVDLKLQKKDGQYEYKVKLNTKTNDEVDMIIDAATGEMKLIEME